MPTRHLPDASLLRAAWRKSSYSNEEGGDCVEVADGVPGVVPVRDSKNPRGAALVVTVAAWRAFVAHVGC